eukprot:UC1_evm1s833
MIAIKQAGDKPIFVVAREVDEAAASGHFGQGGDGEGSVGGAASGEDEEVQELRAQLAQAERKLTEKAHEAEGLRTRHRKLLAQNDEFGERLERMETERKRISKQIVAGGDAAATAADNTTEAAADAEAALAADAQGLSSRLSAIIAESEHNALRVAELEAVVNDQREAWVMIGGGGGGSGEGGSVLSARERLEELLEEKQGLETELASRARAFDMLKAAC